MRRLLASLSLALPLIAGAQVLPGPLGGPAPLPYESLRAPGQGSGPGDCPLWRSADGRMLALATQAGSAPANDPTKAPSSLDFNVVDASQLMRSTLSYDVAARLSMHVALGQRLWPMTAAHLGDGASCTPGAHIGCLSGTLSSPLRMINGEVGATYHGNHYSVGVGRQPEQAGGAVGAGHVAARGAQCTGDQQRPFVLVAGLEHRFLHARPARAGPSERP